MGGEVVFITGASAGVGRAVAREFARQGARIGLFARGLEGLEAARREVEGLGGEALVLSGDVADAARVEEAASELEARFGPLDVWVNNAMVSVFSPVAEMTPEEYRRVTEVTYLGVVHGTLSALARMKPRDRGCILQVGSALSYRAIPLQSAYCAAKHAVEGFTESLRTELLHERSGVSVTMVQLPALNTPQFDWVRSRLARKAKPVPPIFQPEVAARAVYWAAHRRWREVYVGWPTVKAIVGGSRIAPGYGDRILARRGYDSQQTNEPEDPLRADNLYAPLPGDRGARGRFDAEARDASVQLWGTMHRFGIALTVAGLGVLALTLAAIGFGSRGPDRPPREHPAGSRRARMSLGP
jgi:NAD(P)-dependent dehydrogenase (short-subunit alcohol dehydrogenase family)